MTRRATIIGVVLMVGLAMVLAWSCIPPAEDHPDNEATQVWQVCDMQVDASTAKYESQGGYYVFESDDGDRYAVYENAWPKADPPRRRSIVCDVDPSYYDDPESWNYER